MLLKKLKIAKHQPKRDTSKEVRANEEEDDGDEGDTDSVSTGSSICDYCLLSECKCHEEHQMSLCYSY